jgi:transcriptional regulator with XRE-family HTH domain
MPMTQLKTYGQRLKHRRVELDLTQEELGKIVGVSGQAIGEIERGKTYRSSLTIDLASALKVNPEWLMGRTDDKSPKKAEIEISEILSGFSEEDKEEAVRLIKAWASLKKESQI